MKKVIAMSREYGSGGREVGKLVSESLGIPFYDKELLIEAAKRHNYDLGVLRAMDEKAHSGLLKNILITSDYFYGTNSEDPVFRVHEVIEKTIVALAQEGPCVIIGRCADHALYKKANLLRVFIYASSMEDKIRRAGSVDGVPREKAKAYILKVDKQRDNYYRYITSAQWGDRTNYDAMLDSSALGYELCARIVKEIYTA